VSESGTGTIELVSQVPEELVSEPEVIIEPVSVESVPAQLPEPQLESNAGLPHEATPDVKDLPQEPATSPQPLEQVQQEEPVPADEVVDAPKIEPTASVPMVEETRTIEPKEEEPADAPSQVPERSSEEVLAAVMEAARRRQTELDATATKEVTPAEDSVPTKEVTPAKDSTPDPAIAEPISDLEPDKISEPAPRLTIAPSPDFTSEMQADMPKIDPVLAAEDQIDDLLNTSIIHDSHPASSRLPEPDENPDQQNETTVTAGDTEAGKASAHHRLPDVVVATSTDDNPAPAVEEDGRDHALTGGHKVIQPLEPIVSHQAEFAQELKQLEAQESGASAGTSAAVGTPNLIVPAVVEPVAKEPDVIQPPPALVPFELPEPVVVMPDDDFGLPEAESLEAGDVAAARTKRQADELAAQALAPQAEPPEAAVEPDANAGTSEDESDTTASEKVVRPKHKRSRNRLKSEPEAVATDSDEAKMEPTANETEGKSQEHGSTQAGKLIMPSAANSATQSAPAPRTAAVKPDNLAKGEVFVDDKGNVIVGE